MDGNGISAVAGAFKGLDRAQAATEWKYNMPELGYSGKKLTLPDDPAQMPIPSAIEHLNRLQKAKDTPAQPVEFIKCFPFDGAVAFQRALTHLFGWATAEMVPGMFGPQPPKLISVQTGPNPADAIVVPLGEFSIPALPNDHRIGINFDRNEGEFGVTIYGKTTREFENVVREVAKTTREALNAHSVYKGKAFKLFTTGENVDVGKQPEFMDTTVIRPGDLHLNHEVMQAVETSIFTPIKYTDKCLRLGVPLKRGVLLEGPYGVGKSLISTITSQVATDNKWTFITIEDPSALHDTLLLARQYQPAVVFCEDIDRVVTLERDDEANEILNLVDGILSKNTHVMVIFTTNHVDKISKAMLRPGRLDAVISIRPPNAQTIARLIHYYGRGTVEMGADLEPVAKALEGQIPATIREVVERAKLHTIPRINGDEECLITADDLMVTAVTMTRHLELLNAPEQPREKAEQLLRDLGKFLQAGATDEVIEEIKNFKDTADSWDDSSISRDGHTHGKIAELAEGLGNLKRDTEPTLKIVKSKLGG